jgi:tetratricopeptide (TPR) repeat protein
MGATKVFSRALDLFEKNREHISSTRGWTDFGIALHRTGQNEKAIEILSQVCDGGIAPAEAFGYLGYAKWRLGRLDEALDALRKGIEIAPANLTINFYFARVLADIANRTPVQNSQDAADVKRNAAAAFCRAGEIARSLREYSSAGRNGVRALKLEPTNEQALQIAVDSYMTLDRTQLALLIVNRFLIGESGHPTALAFKGVLLRDLGDPKGSVQVLRSIQVNSPDLAWIKAQLAVSLSADSTNIGEALEAATYAVTLDPSNHFVFRVLGCLQVDNQDYEAGVATLWKARELGDNSQEVAEYLAHALMSLGNYEQVEKELRVLTTSYPRSFFLHYLSGISASYLKNPERALAHYRTASRLAPEEPRVFINLMELLDGDDRRPQAIDEVERRLSGPLRYLALWYRARFEIEGRDWAQARRTFDEAIHAAEGKDAWDYLPGILVDYGDALRQHDDYEVASEVYNRAYALAPSRQDVLFGKGLYHCDVAEFEQAYICLKGPLDLRVDDPSYASLWGLRGWSLQHLGDAPEAVKSYRKAFELTGGQDPWSRKGLANCLMNVDKDEAFRHFEAIVQEQKYQLDPESAIERPSGDVNNIGLLGWCNYRLGRYDEAIRLLETVLSRSSDKPALQFDLALIFLVSGRTRLAIDAYQSGAQMTSRCAKLRQRGIYYVALFDLVDAREHLALAESKNVFTTLIEGLRSTGLALSRFAWLAKLQLEILEANPSVM